MVIVFLKKKNINLIPMNTTSDKDLSKDPVFGFMLTLDSGDLCGFACDSIKHDKKSKINIIKYASMLGNDLACCLLKAVELNDIIAVATCLKYNADINRVYNGNSFLHICTSLNRSSLLKSFINKGLDVNKPNTDGLTALDVAILRGQWLCAQILANSGGHLSHNLLKDDFTLVELLLENYKPEFKENISYVCSTISKDFVAWKTKIHKHLKNQIIKQNWDFIEIILGNFPHLMNAVVQKTTLLNLVIDSDACPSSLVNKLIKSKGVILQYPDETLTVPYLHQLAYRQNMEAIKYILHKKPENIAQVYFDKRTVIDHLLMSSQKYSTEVVIDCLEFLLSKFEMVRQQDKISGKSASTRLFFMNAVNAADAALNRKNRDGYGTLEITIQYANTVILEYLITKGLKIKVNIVDPSVYHPAISNNDPLAFASWLGKVEFLDTLIKHQAPINLSNNMPTCLMNAIHQNQDHVVDQLMGYPEIAKLCTHADIRTKLLNFCVDSGIGNKNIMKHFTCGDEMDYIEFNVETMSFNKLEKDLQNVVIDYRKYRFKVLLILYNTLLFLRACVKVDSERQLNNLVDKYVYIVSNQHFEQIKGFIIESMFHVSNAEEIKTCFEKVQTLLHFPAKQVYEQTLESLIALRPRFQKTQFLSKLTNQLQIIKSKFDSLPDEISTYSIHLESDEDYIHRVLIQLSDPHKLPHYDDMHTRISGLNCLVKETPSFLLAKDNNTNLISLIFRGTAISETVNKTVTVGKNWFHCYNFNIGREAKCDYLHMFPFVLDKKLKDVICYEVYRTDMVNAALIRYGKIHMLYFLGMLVDTSEPDRELLGIYEYFIDATKSLFHRFFRPMDQISPTLLSNVMRFYPNFEHKHTMAKHFIQNV